MGVSSVVDDAVTVEVVVDDVVEVEEGEVVLVETEVVVTKIKPQEFTHPHTLYYYFHKCHFKFAYLSLKS